MKTYLTMYILDSNLPADKDFKNVPGLKVLMYK